MLRLVAGEVGAAIGVDYSREMLQVARANLAAAGLTNCQVRQADMYQLPFSAGSFDAAFGGARRDEEKARAKERVFSHRDAFGGWRPRAQRPELWGLFNRHIGAGEHMRVFPLSNWTEADVWAYIVREHIELPNLYYAHHRSVVRRNGLLFPITDLTPAAAGDDVENLSVRFRTVGDVTCTCPVESVAADARQVLTETLSAEVSERGATRMDDRANAAAMERRKVEGYF